MNTSVHPGEQTEFHRSRNRYGAPRRFRVLVVEDNPDIAETMSMLLELVGHDVRVAGDGRVALAVAQSFRPEVMLVDIGLPEIDGYEVARRIRSNRELGNVLLVALTGYGTREDKLRAQAAGFDHHLTKPIEFEALNTILGEYEPAA